MDEKPGFEQLYHDHKKMVFNLALQYVQNSEDAEEITQDVFISVHQSLDSFNEQSKISTWIYRISINKSLDFIKAKKRKKRFAFLTSLFKNEGASIKYDKAGFDHPGVLIEQKEGLEKIFFFINQLPENQKTALILNKIEHQSLAEIAEIMNIGEKAVESLVQRAKKNLLTKLNPNEGNEK